MVKKKLSVALVVWLLPAMCKSLGSLPGLKHAAPGAQSDIYDLYQVVGRQE